MAQLTVGVIGIGAFGSRVALRLLWNGYHALQLYDVSDISTRQFTNDYGGLATGSPKMMAQTCDAVITALPSAVELREVCFGWENLASGFGNGALVINLGICDPAEIAAIGRELAEGGIALLDAPAFGTPAEAKEGKLSLLVGGDERAFVRARPILETLAQKVERVGEAGAPQALGAIGDYLRGAELLAASEALRIAEKFGLDPDCILRLREEGSRAKLSALLRQQVLTRRFGSGVSLGMIHRNMATASKLAATIGVASPLLEATRAAWEEAEATLGSGADHTAIIRWLEALPPSRDPESAEPAVEDCVPDAKARATPLT